MHPFYPSGSHIDEQTSFVVIELIHEKSEMQASVASWRNAGLTVALVPTMGSLHDGHLSLVCQAATRADKVVVTIYVNRSQFSENEDFDHYPRTLHDDIAKLEKMGHCHCVYAPTKMYDDCHNTMVTPSGAARGLETTTRPHFFTGVATIVLKLFQHVPAHFAMFGEKDFQQLSVVRQMVRDLDLQMEIVGAKTVRDKNGVALSSRNHYLSESQAKIAPHLYAQLCLIAQQLKQGIAQETVLSDSKKALISKGFEDVEYLEICDALTLQPARDSLRNIRIMAAVRLGKTRLIDNIAFDDQDAIA